MARFRLRFLLQELDLIGPVVTLGRSTECQITLEDPLVSRVHAQLTIGDDGVRVRDLGSRNGVRVNGQLITEETTLQHNDRVRLGTQDLVFLVLEPRADGARAHKATGSIAHCRECERPFPGECAACPHCGAPNKQFAAGMGPETITSVEVEDAPNWTFRLIAEVIERALSAGRLPEAERMLERAARDLDGRVASGRKLGLEQVVQAARFGLRLARLKRKPSWAEWVAHLYRHEQLLPEGEALDLFEALDPDSLRAVRPDLEALLIDYETLSHRDMSFEDRAKQQRLSALLAGVS